MSATTSRADGTDTDQARRSVRRGWAVVAGAFLTLFSILGTTYSFSAFFVSLQEQFHASRGEVSQILSIVLFVYHMIGAVSGPIADRFGPRGLGMAGVAAVGSGFVAASMATALWHVYLAFGLIGIGIGAAYVPSLAAVQRWFIRQRGFASGIAVSGVGVGTLVMPLAATQFILLFGWRGAFVALAACALVVGGGGVLLLDGAPERRGMLPDGGTSNDKPRPPAGVDLREALRSPIFWALYLALFLIAVGQFVPFAHLVPYAEDHGLSSGSAALIFGLIGVGSTLGRLVLGRFADRYGRRKSLVAMYVGMAAIMAWWLTSVTAWQLSVFALVFGICYGGFVALAPAVTIDYFGSRNASGIIGVLYTAVALGTLIGPRLAGDAFDLYHSYMLPIAICAGASLTAAIIVLLLPGQYSSAAQPAKA